MPRLKSEAIVRAQCDAGLAAYLAEIHKKDLTSSAGTGIFLGTIISGSIWGVSKVLNEKFGLLEYSFIFGGALLSSILSAVLTWNNSDSQHELDFETVCGSLEDSDESEEDEDEEDNDVEESEEYYSEEKLLPTKILM